MTKQPTILLLYKPPCGMWYVHSHKLYHTAEEANDAARRFLYPGTPFDIVDLTEHIS